MKLREFIIKHVYISPKNNCWIWQGTCYSSGYGYCRHPESTSTLAHKVAFEAFIGPIPGGRRLRRSCEKKNCCNPFHYAIYEGKTPAPPVPRHHEYVSPDTELLEDAIRLWAIKVGYNS